MYSAKLTEHAPRGSGSGRWCDVAARRMSNIDEAALNALVYPAKFDFVAVTEGINKGAGVSPFRPLPLLFVRLQLAARHELSRRMSCNAEPGGLVW